MSVTSLSLIWKSCIRLRQSWAWTKNAVLEQESSQLSLTRAFSKVHMWKRSAFCAVAGIMRVLEPLAPSYCSWLSTWLIIGKKASLKSLEKRFFPMILFRCLARLVLIRMQFTLFPNFRNNWHFWCLLGTIGRKIIPVAPVQKSLFVYIYLGVERELQQVVLKCWLWYVNPWGSVYFYAGWYIKDCKLTTYRLE